MAKRHGANVPRSQGFQYCCRQNGDCFLELIPQRVEVEQKKRGKSQMRQMIFPKLVVFFKRKTG